jgi:hypothetical protein
MLTQMNIQIGLQTFDRKGNDANLLQQLHNKKAFIQRADISYQDIKKALRYLVFLKEKWDRSVKAIGCADRSTRQEYTTKNEASSPTVFLEAMMLPCAIDTK